MAEEASLSDDHKKDVKVGETAKKDAKKSGGFVQKYKWYILGGVILVGLVLVWLVNRNQGSSGGTSADAGDQSAINPSTGYLNGSPADLAALGSGGVSAAAPGPPGDPGEPGPAGPAGAPGSSSVNLYQMAKKILQARGIKNPSTQQIWNVRNTLEHIGARPVTHKPPVHKPTPKKGMQMKPGAKKAA
jgi:hypothetical protein